MQIFFNRFAMKKFFLALALLSVTAMLAGCLPAKEAEEATTEEETAVEESTVVPETSAEVPAETPVVE